MATDLKQGAKVLVSRESEGRVLRTEPAEFVRYSKTRQSLYVRLQNGDVIKRKLRQVVAVEEEPQK